MLDIRRSEDRGQVDLGWLQSRHTFSFGSYHDPRHMGVSALRVINDDRVLPGAGFGTHSHRDMEIISYVKRGTIEHEDSMGNVERLPAGEFQLMSAGTGITHSEYNPSADDMLEFLQIWVLPERKGITPGYQQKRFDTGNALTLVASPDARDGSLRINQDVCLYHARLARGQASTLELANGRTAYVHLVSGGLSVDDEALEAGDGVSVRDVSTLSLQAHSAAEALVFDLP